MNLLQEGGPMYMYITLLSLLICVGLIIKAFIKGDETKMTTKLIGHLSLFTLVWGFLGFFTGMIVVLDTISVASNSIGNPLIATGLKVALLSPSFGIVVFLIARLGIIGIHLKNK